MRRLLASVVESVFHAGDIPQSHSTRFNADLSASISLNAFTLDSLSGNAPLPRSGMSLNWNATTRTANVQLKTNHAGILDNGWYEATWSDEALPINAEHRHAFRWVLGDLNHDGVVSNQDIGLFLELLNGTPPAGTGPAYGDMNRDGVVNNQDISPFIAALTSIYSTRMPDPLAAPGQIVTWALSSTSIRINWTPPLDGTPDGYRIYRSIDGTNFVEIAELVNPELQPGGFFYDDTNLSHGTKYWYRIRPFFDDPVYGRMNGHTTEKVWSCTVLPGVADVAVQPISGSSARVSWVDQSDTETGFEVRRYDPDSGQWSLLTTVGAGVTEVVLNSLPSDATLYLSVRSINVETHSASSEIAPTITPPAGAGMVVHQYELAVDQSTGLVVAVPGVTVEPNRSATYIGVKHVGWLEPGQEFSATLTNLPAHDWATIGFSTQAIAYNPIGVEPITPLTPPTTVQTWVDSTRVQHRVQAFEEQGSATPGFFGSVLHKEPTLTVRSRIDAATPARAEDRYVVTDLVVTLYAQGVDLDVDSNNTGTIDHSNIEEVVEDDAARGGKVIQTNAHDVDEDGIPDFADGYDRNGTPGADDISNGVKFVPCTIRVAEPFDPRQARFRFDYAASDPAQVQRTGDGTLESPYIFTAADGHLRLWTRDNDQIRNATPANQAGGNYIAPGAEFVYSGEQLGFVGNSRTTTVWIEAVRHHQAVGDGRIVVHLDPDGPGPMGFTSEDAVRVTAVAARLAVDANGDGTINTDNRDFTTAERPFRFWLNDNSDGYDDTFSGGVAGLVGDYPKDLDDTYIGSDIGTNGDADRRSGVFRRDLEDFAAVNLAYSQSTALLSDKVEIQIKGASSSNMKLRLWRANSSQGVEFEDNTKLRSVQSTRHVTAPGFADAIEAVTNNYHYSNPSSFRGIYADEPVELNTADFENDFGLKRESDGVTFAMLLFEGVVAGSGKVTITFKKGNTVIATSAFDLDLHKSDDLYEHYTVATGPGVAADGTWSSSGTTIDPRTTPVPTTPTLVAGGQAAQYARDKDYVLFVHGWKMTAPERVSFADTAYKRLYWQGYRGTFGLFSWPTQRITGIPRNSTEAGNFNRSEEIAWNSAAGLRSLLNSKQSVRRSGGKLALIGHSMGGIVVSEALAQSGTTNIVDTTVLTQAAVTSEFYVGVANPTPYYSAFGGEVGGTSPRFRHIDRATTKLVNFNNEVDFALALWYENNNAKPGGPDYGSWSVTGLLPPAGFLNARYEVAAGSPATVTRNVPGAAPVVLTFPADRYEMFAHGLYTEAIPIGRANAWPGPFTHAFDLRNIGFGATRSDHSGQFNHTNISMKRYWARFMQEAGL